MPQVFLEDKNTTVAFPDGMTPAEMEKVIWDNFYAGDVPVSTFGEREEYRAKKGRAVVDVGKSYWRAMNGELPIEEARNNDAKIMSQFTKETEERFKPDNIIERFAGATTELAPYMFDSAIQGALYGEIFGAGAATTAIIGGQMGPQVAIPEEIITAPVAYLGGRMVGQAYGAWTNAAQVEGGNIYKDLLDEGITPDVARSWAIPAGYLIGAVELLQLSQLIPMGKQGIKEALKTVAKKSAAKTTARFIGKVAGKTAITAGLETTEEEVQEAISIAADIGAQLQMDENVDKEDFEGYRDRLKDTLVQSLYGFPLLGLPGSVYTTVQSHGREHVMNKVAERIQTQRAQEAKVNELAPVVEEAQKYDTFKDFSENTSIDISDKDINDLGFDNKPLMLEAIWNESRDVKNEDDQIAKVQKEEKVATPEQLQGRITYLEAEQKRVTDEIDRLTKEKMQAEEQGRPTKAIENNIAVLNEQNDALDTEMADLITEDKVKLSTEKIQVEARKLDKISKEAKELGVREGKSAQQAKNKEKIQVIANLKKQLIDYAEMVLPKSERGAFITAVANVNTQKQLQKQVARVGEYQQAYEKRQTVRDIKRQIQRLKTSKSVAIEYVDKILDLIKDYELQGRTEKTMKRLEETKKFIEENGTENIPSYVLKELDILGRKPLSEIDNATLKDIGEKVKALTQLGKTKLRSRRAAEKIVKANDLAAIKKDSKKIETRKTAGERPAGLGEKTGVLENFMNGVKSALNKAQAVDLAITPMDVIFDLLDGVKGYVGANYRIFKQRVDVAYSKYLNMKFDIQGRIDTLANELNLDNVAMERIGIYAAAQQEGGIEKLEASGITKEEVESIKLTGEEKRLYDAMQKELNNLRPVIEEVMRVVYNQPLGKVKNYFPFMMDFDTMSDKEIRDRFGDSVEQFGTGRRKNVEMGLTKRRVGGENKIRLNAYDVFMRHIDNASYLVTVGRETKYLGELAAADEYLDAVGDVGQEIVRDWIDLVARKGKTADGRNRALDVIRKYTGLTALGFKLGSALVQITSLMDGAALIGPEYAFGGFKNIITDKEWRTFIKENFPEYRNRIGDDPAFNGFEGDGFYEKLGRAGMWGLQTVDKLTAAGVLAGAYERACKNLGVEVDFAHPNKEAIIEATRMMRRTQSSSEFKDLPSAFSRGGLTGSVSVDKLLLQFQSFMLNRWSLIKHDAFRAGIMGKNKIQATNIAMWLIAANFAELGIRRITKEAIAQLMGKELPEDDDEKEDTRKLLQVLSNIPFAGQIASSAIYGGMPVPSLSMIGKIFENTSKALRTDDEDVAFWKWIKAGVSMLPGGQQLSELVPEE